MMNKQTWVFFMNDYKVFRNRLGYLTAADIFWNNVRRFQKK